MQFWFFISIIGFIAIIPPYFLSLEHLKLEKKYGKEKGRRIGEILGIISGWGFFIFWLVIWFSPQDRFAIPFLQDIFVQIPVFNLSVFLVNSLIFIPLFVVGAWFGIKGVIQTSLRVAETHRTETITITGVYSIVRHPQYLGGILAHIGFSIFLSAFYSLLATPLVIAVIYIISWKEENELTNEFGEEYADYKKRVPMIIPRLLD